MKYTVVVFNSRNDSMTFYNLIKRHIGFCSIINTPRTVSRACGISIKISGAYINTAIQIISSHRFSTFIGIYEINIVNRREIPNKIY